MSKPFSASLLALGLLFPAEAVACRVQLPPATLIARDGHDTVATAEVVRAGYLPAAVRGTKPWRGIVAIRRVLVGDLHPKRLSIGRSGAPTACDDGIPPPRRGERWVLYLSHAGGKARVVNAYPVETARSSDPGLDALLARAGGG